MPTKPLLKFSDVLTIISLIAGPVLAVQAQKWVEGAKEARNRREWFPKTPMTNLLDSALKLKQQNIR